MFQFPWVHQQQQQQQQIRSDKDSLLSNVNPDGKSDDVVADELLSRFPEYGSTTNALLSITSSTGNDYYDDDDQNADDHDDNGPLPREFSTNTNVNDAWNDTYGQGMGIDSKVVWRAPHQRPPKYYETTTSGNNGDGTLLGQGAKINWWNIPMLPGNVPMFRANRGNEETKTGEAMTDGTASAATKTTDPSKNNSKGNSTHLKQNNNNVRNTGDINTQWDPMEQNLWKQQQQQSTPEDLDAPSKTVINQRPQKQQQQQHRQWIIDYQKRNKGSGANDAIPHIRPDESKNHPAPKSLAMMTPPRPNQRNAPTDDTVDETPKLPSAIRTIVTRESSPKSGSSSNHIQLPPPPPLNNWMPDDLYKACTNCDVPFTIFRRKHHCRDCGQIFCHNCSSYYVVPVQQLSSTTTTSTNMTVPQSVRVCRTCYGQHHVKNQTTSKTSWNITNESLSPMTDGRTTSSSISHLERDVDYAITTTDRSHHSSHGPPPPPPMTNNEATPKRSHVSVPLQPQPQQLVHRVGSSVQDYQRQIQDGNVHMGMIAATHLELMAQDLLRLHAPLIWNKTLSSSSSSEKEALSSNHTTVDIKPIHIKAWVNALLSLATRCCATVSPNVKKGDLLDVRPYIKVKVIPGGSMKDCAYISGVMFRKTVSHKRMAREVLNPKILLLSGGIDFVRNSESRISSLETLFEQEDKYMELLVNKILKLEPDIVLVGRSVNRKAQEILLKANVILIQHVKMNLLNRIARQTNATIVSSTDHHMLNQLSVDVLGTCCRFRLVTFRDNETWTDDEINVASKGEDIAEHATESKSVAVTTSVQEKSDLTSEEEAQVRSTIRQRSIRALLDDQTLTNHERQAVLAAQRLGEKVLDGADAVRAGLAKRGVAHTYVMLEGCPKHLGCTVVLRGANRAALKQLKGVFRFLANCAYNIRLETTYLKERGARLRPDIEVHPANAFSSSLCVDYGHPPDGRKIRPWNGGGKNEATLPRTDPAELSPIDHQSILITSVWMTEKTQCCPAEVKGICYYSQQDVALGQFLRDSCFNLSLKCQNPNCKKSVLDHSLSFVHNDGLINIVVEEMDEPVLPPGTSGDEKKNDSEQDEGDDGTDRPIATWTYCQNCRKVVTPLKFISDLTWKFSFGKFLEVFFYNRDAILNAPNNQCSCNLQTSAMLYFGCGKLGARFTYERITPYGVFVRKTLPFEESFHRKEAMRRLDFIAVESSSLFISFDKHIEKISREARSLFNSAMNRPEHLQTVLSELNKIGSEVDQTAMILHEKIAAVAENCRRSEDTSLNSALFRFPLFARRYLFNVTTAWNEKLSAAGQAISAMKRIAAASNSQDGAITPNVTIIVSDSLNDELTEGMKRLRQLIEHYERYNITDITHVLPSQQVTGPGNDVAHDGDFDEEFDDPDTSLDFAEGVDADVIASRRRLKSNNLGQISSLERQRTRSPKPTKTLGTRRALTDVSHIEGSLPTSTTSAPPKPTPGGAVKSAITRFFNRGGRDSDPYIVDLGMFTEGRPRLPPGVDGIFVPVVDDRLSTIIAYSLASIEYSKQFKHFTKETSGPVIVDQNLDGMERGRRSGPRPELDEGIINNDVAVASTDHRGNGAAQPIASNQSHAPSAGPSDEVKATERRMMNRNKSHIKHTFRDVDEKGQVTCKFVCTTYWATQFHAVRQCFLSPSNLNNKGESLENASSNKQNEIEQCYIESLGSTYSWAASGGKSGANFARTADDRFVIKCISRTELQMFLESAPAYFEYLCKAFYHGLPTVLCKIVGVYQIGVHNRENGKRSMEQVAVMQNVFYNRRITKIFDLKGSLRGRFAAQLQHAQNSTQQGNNKQLTNHDHSGTRGKDTPKERNERGSKNSNNEKWLNDTDSRQSTSSNSLVEDSVTGSIETPLSLHHVPSTLKLPPTSVKKNTRSDSKSESNSENEPQISTLLDGDFLEFTSGRPMPLTDRAKAVFQMSILNDTLFLNYIYVLDYSILVGFDEENKELVVGIIDFMRQYDILKQMERVGKSLPMVVGSEAPTIIQPPLYKARFTNAMERYFMTVPSKWTTI